MSYQFVPYQIAQYQISEADCAQLSADLGESCALRPQRPTLGCLSFSPFVSNSGANTAPLISAVIEGISDTITSKIAVKMSLDAIRDATLGLLQEGRGEQTLPSSPELIRAALKAANSEVYRYGKSMLASGGISATGVVCACDGDSFAIARVGDFEAYLWRDGVLGGFYESASSDISKREQRTRFIGADKQILVDIASAPVQNGDVIISTTLPPNEKVRRAIAEVLGQSSDLSEIVQLVASICAHESLESNVGGEGKVIAENVYVFGSLLGEPNDSFEASYRVGGVGIGLDVNTRTSH